MMPCCSSWFFPFFVILLWTVTSEFNVKVSAMDLVITASNYNDHDNHTSTSSNSSQDVTAPSSAVSGLLPLQHKRPPETIVLLSGESLGPGRFVYSPSRQYRVGLTNDTSELILEEDVTVLLSSSSLSSSSSSSATTTTTTTTNITTSSVQHFGQKMILLWSSGMTRSHSTEAANNGNNNRLNLQTDGNLVVRNVDTRQRIWTTHTSGLFPSWTKSKLVIDDGGQIALVVHAEDLYEPQRVWFAGLPPDYYYQHDDDQKISDSEGDNNNNNNMNTTGSLSFPVRATFYYPWYPETFKIKGHMSHFQPSLGWYSSSDPKVAISHIESMDYGHIDLAIASWWGPDTHLDRPRITMLMDATIQMKSSLKWTVYYEVEMKQDPSVEKIRKDLNYLLAWYGRHPAYAKIDGRPLIFVYNDGNDLEGDGCDIVRRWMEASQGEWYVVLKVFRDFDDCPVQSDSWHQYGSGQNGVVRNRGYSFVVSPGFWKAANDKPRVPRLSAETYCQNVKKMTESDDPWQLVLSFNEAGEGTMIEPSRHWASSTKHGQYLDCLHGIIPKSSAEAARAVAGGVRRSSLLFTTTAFLLLLSGEW